MVGASKRKKRLAWVPVAVLIQKSEQEFPMNSAHSHRRDVRGILVVESQQRRRAEKAYGWGERIQVDPKKRSEKATRR